MINQSFCSGSFEIFFFFSEKLRKFRKVFVAKLQLKIWNNSENDQCQKRSKIEHYE